MRRILACVPLIAIALSGRAQTAGQAVFFHNHCVFVHDGYLKPESSTPKQLLAHYIREGRDEPIVIHFHGGLVSEASAKQEAWDLEQTCYGGRSYPIFIAWNADLFSELGNLLESRYHNEAYAQGRVSTAAFLAGIFEDARKNGLSLTDVSSSGKKLMAAYRQFMAQDRSFQRTVTAEASKNNDILGTGKNWADWTDASTWLEAKKRLERRVTNYFGPYVQAFMRYHDRYSVSWGGDLLEWVSRDLGGRDIWKKMKQDTALSFTVRNGVAGAGLQLISALRDLPRRPRIVLVGHSTGCIYITNFLAAARRMIPGAKFDVVYLAPANTYEDMAKFLASNSDEIGNFRMFGIQDRDERKDHMLWQLNPSLGGVYPGSLLIYVSRAVESRPNMPLLGLRRDFPVPASGADRTASLIVHRDLLDRPGAVVWSPSTGPVGYCSNCVSHGDFCSDPATLVSLRYLVANRRW